MPFHGGVIGYPLCNVPSRDVPRAPSGVGGVSFIRVAVAMAVSTTTISSHGRG